MKPLKDNGRVARLANMESAVAASITGDTGVDQGPGSSLSSALASGSGSMISARGRVPIPSKTG